MKANQAKKALTFGEFIMAVYDAWGKRRARGIVWLAINARLLEFRGHDRFVILEPGPDKIFSVL
jgi:CO dehydrogenase/acetyl-CoA synthase delta subunit